MRRTILALVIAVAVIGGAGYAGAASSSGLAPAPEKPTDLAGNSPQVSADGAGSTRRSIGSRNSTIIREYTQLPTPCRLYDSRTADGPLQPGTARVVPINKCTIPTYATALNASVSSVSPSGPGFLRAWPNGAAQPTTTLLQWGTTAATTGASVPMNGSGIKVQASAATGLVIDVAGYYTESIYADVLTASSSAFADMYSSTGMISGYSSALASPGQMIVQIRRDILYCDIQATAETSGYIATAVYTSSNSFVIKITDSAGTPVRAYASVKVTC